jgi:hypothetical protein
LFLTTLLHADAYLNQFTARPQNEKRAMRLATLFEDLFELSNQPLIELKYPSDGIVRSSQVRPRFFQALGRRIAAQIVLHPEDT